MSETRRDIIIAFIGLLVLMIFGDEGFAGFIAGACLGWGLTRLVIEEFKS